MDLLGDIGMTDQLTSVREENKVLQERCKELKLQVSVLTIENESLKAELEIFRNSVAVPNFNSLSLGTNDANTVNNATTSCTDDVTDLFVRSGNGQYVIEDDHITISNLHDVSNILSCSLSDDGVYLATGGADGTVRITQWGAAYDNNVSTIIPIAKDTDASNTTSTDDSMTTTTTLVATDFVRNVYSNATQCGGNGGPAPVISVRFAPSSCGLDIRSGSSLVATGCMDGSVQLVSCATTTSTGGSSSTVPKSRVVCRTVHSMSKHDKYIRDIAWSPTHPIVSSASADGTVQLHTVSRIEEDYTAATTTITTDDIQMATSLDNDDDQMIDTESGYTIDDPVTNYTATPLESLHFPGSVECIAYTGDGSKLVCYARGTPYLSIFDIQTEFQQMKVNLNELGDVTGGFSDHVSYAIMNMSFSPQIQYSSTVLACATDTSRNLIIDLRCNKCVRTLFGHSNDSYSQPKIAWSTNGQYLYGNTQTGPVVCTWDIASAKIVTTLKGHANVIRDMYTTPHMSDTLVTTSFDKQTKLWFGRPEQEE